MISRHLTALLEKSPKSVLLLGPRQTGKSTLIRNLKPDLEIDLADEQAYLQFARNPEELKQRLGGSRPKTVFVDEVQRLPGLLNTIQTILDRSERPIKFYLTGSSARKLRKGQANLLPGRVHTYELGPLSCGELDYECDSVKALETGTLPGIYVEENREERIKTLRSYAGTYLKEEVQTEALTRNLEGFSRFLFLAAECSGQYVDVAKLSSESQVPRQSAARYLEILEDTLIVNRCPPFTRSDRKRLVLHPKYYFFDTGVLNGLLGNFEASPDRIGRLFEHLFFNQLLAGAKARDRDIRVSNYRTEHGAEIDFIVELEKDVWAVELKSSSQISRNDLRGFKSFSDFFGKKHRSVIAYRGQAAKEIDGIRAVPWQQALKEMGL